MDPVIRTIAEDEFEAYAHAAETAFGAFLEPDDLERERSIAELDRTYAAFDGERIVGTAAVITIPMTVPGADLDVGFVVEVGVVPSHTRQGINTALMRRTLEDARERGEAVDVLFASEGGIYGRFGYAIAAPDLSLDARADRSAFVRGYAPSGPVGLVPEEEGRAAILEVHGAIRARRPGSTELNDALLRYTLHDHGDDKGKPRFWAVHDGSDGIDGYLVYRVKHEWETGAPENVLEVHLLDAADPGAYADLWRFAFDHDLVSKISAWARPIDEPLLHLVQEPRRLNARRQDGLWLRLVDVPSALRSRAYAADGRIVLQVHDRFCPWNDGRYALEVEDGAATCGATGDAPDLVLTVNEVAAAYLGGPSFRQLSRAGRVTEERPGAMARADAMFGWDPAPWCPFGF